MNNTYETLALLYAEKYGIISYEVEGNIMSYKEEFPKGNGKYEAYSVKVDLDSNKETRKEIK